MAWVYQLCWCAAIVAMVAQAVGTHTDDSVAKPEMGESLEQLVAPRARTARLVRAPGENDVTVAGVLYSRGNLHTASNVVCEDSIHAAKNIRAKKKIVATEGFETAGTLSVSKKITALASILAKEDIVAEGTLKTSGGLVVQLATNSHGIINAHKGIVSSGIVRSKENIVSEKSVIATALLQSDGGVFTKGTINSERRVIAKGDIHSESLMTSKEGFVTPGNVFAEKVVKAGTDVRAGGQVFALGSQIGSQGIESKGKIHSGMDVSTEGSLVSKRGVKTSASVVADKSMTAQEIISNGALEVKQNAKIGDKLDVAGHATMASVTVKGQLYVGNKAIGDLMQSMSAELERSKLEMATMRATLEELTSMLKQK